MTAEIPVAEIGYEDRRYEAGGLGRRLSVFRLPDRNPHRTVRLERRLPILDTGGPGARDNAFYVRIVQEDGHVAWSSPIYVFS